MQPSCGNSLYQDATAVRTVGYGERVETAKDTAANNADLAQSE